MAAVAVWRDPDLRELQLRPARDPSEVEDDDRVVIGPPSGSAPRLDDLLARSEHQIVAAQMPLPGTEPASHLPADDCLFSRKRCMFLGVADEAIHLPRRGALKHHGLRERLRLHIFFSSTEPSPRSLLGHRSQTIFPISSLLSPQ